MTMYWARQTRTSRPFELRRASARVPVIGFIGAPAPGCRRPQPRPTAGRAPPGGRETGGGWRLGSVLGDLIGHVQVLLLESSVWVPANVRCMLVRQPSYQSTMIVVYSYPMKFHPKTEDIELAAVLHALSDPHRLRIVGTLAQDSEPR